jgi:hypothetical protein
MKINEWWEELKAQSGANVQSKKGILNRQICPIGRNINKYHRFLCNTLQKFEGKEEEKAA